jgi:NAD(P)H dehydrogenase (quinone)
MNVLFVFANPERNSFNGALLDAATAALTQAGHSVQVSDLYAMRFKAVADETDFIERADPSRLVYSAEQMNAWDAGTTAPDIVAEQEKLRWADAAVFQFPLWWYSVPAILKGWFERVLSMGWAYGRGNMFDKGGVGGVKAMLSFTTNGSEASYRTDGWHGPIETVVNPLHCGLRFVGFRPVEPFIAYDIVRGTDEARAAYLKAIQDRVLALDSAEPVDMVYLEDYDRSGRRNA